MKEFLLSLPQYLYTSLIVVFTTIAVFVSLTGMKLRDGRGHGRKWYKGFTNAGRFVILLSILTAVFTYLKDFAAEMNIEKTGRMSEQKADSIRKATDSVAVIRTNMSNTNIVNSFTNALAKFGLKYDSTSNAITKRLDTVKSEQKIYYGADPIVTIQNIKHEKDSLGKLNFRVELSVANQPALASMFYVLAISQSKTGKLYIDKYVRIINNQTIPLNISSGNNILLDKFDGSNTTYFLFYGTYKNSKNQEFTLKEYFSHTIGQAGYSGVGGELRKLIDQLLESKGLRF